MTISVDSVGSSVPDKSGEREDTLIKQYDPLSNLQSKIW